MTLKEAYERLRKEVLSLRAENEKLKNGTFIDKEKAALEKEVRQLSKSLSEKDKKLSRVSERYERSEELHKRIQDRLEEDIQVLETKVAELEEKVVQQDKEISELKAVNEKLAIQINRDYQNSSIPSSEKPFHRPITNSREATGRKPGAQKGHKGHCRRRLNPTEPVIHIPVPPEIAGNPDYYLTGEMVTKQLIDILISVKVTEYKAPVLRNRSTGTRYVPKFPDGVVNEVNYGSGIKAMAFLLNSYCNVSIAKTRQFISELTNGEISVSAGTISGLGKIFTTKTRQERRKLFDRLLAAPVLYSDATVSRINGKYNAVIVCTNENETLYFAREHKGHEGIKGTPVEKYLFTLVHDHDKTFYGYGNKHQECLAHILRYLRSSMENEPCLTWNSRMYELIREMIHARNISREITPEQKNRYISRYREILALGQEEYIQHPHAKYYPDGYNLCRRLDQYMDSTLYFLENTEVEVTNNISERALRKFKRKMKQAVTFRSAEGVENTCNALSIFETARKHGRNIYEIVKSVFNISSEYWLGCEQ